MNEVSNEEKSVVLNILAIVGFLAVVVLGVWLAIKIVALMPSAFNSLASIADGVYNYNETNELVVSTEDSTVTTGQAFTLEWDELDEAGVYTFSFACTDGVSLDIRDAGGDITSVPCDESMILAVGTDSVDVTVESERQRFTEVAYTIAFVPNNVTEPTFVSENMISVVNANIPEGDTTATDVETEPEADGQVLGVDDTDTEPVVAEPTSAPTPTPNIPTEPRVIETVILETPASDPNGFVDLAVRLTGVGELDSNGNFIRRNNIDEDAKGAFTFEVVNVGTKTSDEWDFVATLTSGTTYNAPDQAPLNPQERVMFTLGYDNVGDDGISEIGVELRGGDDSSRVNNSFTWAVSVVE